MNRLRILKQRIKRSGDVGVCKLSDGYAVATGRFQGAASTSMTQRAAIHLAARWAMPSRPQVMVITDGRTEKTIKTNSRGEKVVTVRELINPVDSFNMSAADLEHHAKFFGTSSQGGVPGKGASTTPSPVDLVRSGAIPFEYLDKFGDDSCWRSNIDEFKTEVGTLVFTDLKNMTRSAFSNDGSTKS